MSLRTPLGTVLGRGAAGEGVSHWWHQRLSAIALIPLSIWFVIALLGHPLQSYDAMRAWLSHPWPAVLTILLVAMLAWHSHLGVQVVIEDYAQAKGVKTFLLLTSVFVHTVAAVAAVFAVLVLALART